MLDFFKKPKVETNFEQPTSEEIYDFHNVCVEEAFEEQRNEFQEYYFLQFSPQKDITTYELLQALLLNNTLSCNYNSTLSETSPVFVNNIVYDRQDKDFVKRHFKIIKKETTTYYDAYNWVMEQD